MQKILFIVLLGSIFSILIYHLHVIHKNSNEIDNLNQILTPVKSLLVEQSNISLISDKQDLALYYRTQFLLVPVIVENQVFENDTILVIEKKGGKKFKCPFDKFKILFSGSNDEYKIFLCIKNFEG